MGLFRKPKPTESPLPAWLQVERPAVRFTGIARSSLERADFTPYEFQTETGVWVRLHDMTFLGFDYQVQPPTMTMRFLYDDPEWTPPEARSIPLAVLRFIDVQVWQWEDDVNSSETPPEVRGQVGDLGFSAPTNVFSLETPNTSLHFSASRLVVELEAWESR